MAISRAEAIVALANESTYEEFQQVAEALWKRHPSTYAAVMAAVMESATEAIEFPPVLQVGEFLRTVGTPPPMFIEGLIPDRSLVLVTGKPKHAKSYIAIDLADRIANAQKAFGSMAVAAAGPTLYIGMEDGRFEIANRMLKRGIRLDAPQPLHICAGRLSLNKPEALRYMDEQLEALKPVLCVIDTAREGCGIRDWTDASEVTEKIRPIRDLARKHCTILLVAHNRKAEGLDGDEIAGSNAFTSSVDGWISVQRKERQDNGDLRVWCRIDGRGDMRGELCLQMDTNDLHFRVVTEEEQQQEKDSVRQETAAGKYQTVLEALEACGGVAGTRDLSIQSGIGFETMKRLIPDMVRDGWLMDSTQRAGPKKNVILWSRGERA